MPQPDQSPPDDQRALSPTENQWSIATAVRLPSGEVVADTRAMENAMLEVGAILQRTGGIVTIHARCAEVAPGQVETCSIVCRSQSFAHTESDVEPPAPSPPQAA